MYITFTLPSAPAVEIRLREATVRDAIDFTGLTIDAEEEATTLFLERMQERGPQYSDPRQWTGEDRRFALFQYFVHTSDAKSIPLTFTHEGVTQTHDIPLSKILETYTPLNGEAFREFPFNGHNVILAPLRGVDLETLEKYNMDYRFSAEQYDDEEGNMTPEQQKKARIALERKRSYLDLLRILCMVDVPGLKPEVDRIARRKLVEEFISSMPVKDFTEFFEKAKTLVPEMRHGLATEYVDGHYNLLIPGIHPDNAAPGVEITIRYPFRFVDIIPHL